MCQRIDALFEEKFDYERREEATHDTTGAVLSFVKISDKKTPLIQYQIEPKGFVT